MSISSSSIDQYVLQANLRGPEALQSNMNEDPWMSP